MEISRIGVVGAGQMGNGIAHVLALAGYEVLLNDVSAGRAGPALAQIGRNIDRQVSRGRVSADDKAAALARIRPTLDLAEVGPCDLIIEAATEREDIKNRIFEGLAPHLAPHTILTSNTSSISITRLASRTDRPERFMGFHFMNPVPVMQLVELIRGIATDEETYAACLAVVDRLGKTAASAEDFPAFIVNRILMPMINEAVYTLYEGVGNVRSIDMAMKLGTNHPMGPLELADFIGLDTCLAIMNVLHDGLADTKYRPCPLLVKYVEAGWLGRKTDRGFYDYRGEGDRCPRADTGTAPPSPLRKYLRGKRAQPARGQTAPVRPLSSQGQRLVAQPIHQAARVVPTLQSGRDGPADHRAWGRFMACTTSCSSSPWRSVAETGWRSGRGGCSGRGTGRQDRGARPQDHLGGEGVPDPPPRDRTGVSLPTRPTRDGNSAITPPAARCAIASRRMARLRSWASCPRAGRAPGS
jgi:3-hydroxybutyryl-CoA dehydrogenase